MLACVIVFVIIGVVEVYRVTDAPADNIFPDVLSLEPAAKSGAFVNWLALLNDNVLLLSAPGAAGLLEIVMLIVLLLLCEISPGFPKTVKLAVLVPTVDADIGNHSSSSI